MPFHSSIAEVHGLIVTVVILIGQSALLHIRLAAMKRQMGALRDQPPFVAIGAGGASK